MVTTNNDDWWTLKELASRWKTSEATLRRRYKMKESSPQKLHAMPNGSQLRVHITEILRHERAGLPEIEEKRTIIKPSPTLKIVARQLEHARAKAREATKKIKQGASVGE